MSANIENPFNEPTLLSAPVMRAAYSDRTAWLMAAMSELAYYKFEDSDLVTKLANELAAMTGADAIAEKLDDVLSGTLGGGNEETLKRLLKFANFDLIKTYNRGETQAFLAKRSQLTGKGMLVLAFRGTEIVKKDILTDANAFLTTLDGEEKVHSGFFQAFNHVKDAIDHDLKEQLGIPLYITGHSLGGALAILATRLLASDSQGACYTFGGPRVGNAQVDDQIKTPIYRVINSADLVPRMPPSFFINLAMLITNFFHLTIVSSFLRRFKGYVHFGDMRYLTHVEPTPSDLFPGLKVHSNPSFPFRLMWIIRRLVSTAGKAGASDHSISLYRNKLKSYAIDRRGIGKPVTIPETEIESEENN
jgi:triacylglycerol lipase